MLYLIKKWYRQFATLWLNSPRNKDSLVVVEARDFDKTITCFFARFLMVGEKVSRTEIQKITENPHKTPFCVCVIVLRMCFSLNLFPMLFDLFFVTWSHSFSSSFY